MIRAVAAAALCSLSATGGAGAVVNPVVRVLANQELLLRTKAGVIACAPSVDEQRVPRMGCGLVDHRGGVNRGPRPGTVVAQVTASGLDLVRHGRRFPELVYHVPVQDGVLSLQTRRATHGTLEIVPGRRYYFSGTRVVCGLAADRTSVFCELVGRDLRTRRPGHGFAIGFSGVRVLRVDAAGHRRAVFSARHDR